jgi:hypothetical protein
MGMIFVLELSIHGRMDDENEAVINDGNESSQLFWLLLRFSVPWAFLPVPEHGRAAIWR